MPQDNSVLLTAISDIRTVLDALSAFAEISGTMKGPEGVSVYPALYYALGDVQDSTFKDVQGIHTTTSRDFIMLVYVHATDTTGTIAAEGRSGDVTLMLAKAEQLIKDAIDGMKSTMQNNGYWRVDPAYLVDTDNGGMAMSGSPIGMMAITIRLHFPPADA